MKLILYRHNYRSQKVETPTLKELLESKEPFVISAQEGVYGSLNRRPVVYAQLHPGIEGLLNGILVIDRDSAKSYQAKRGEYQFQEKEGTHFPWHADKFGVYANFYELEGTFEELKEEFEREGFSFDVGGKRQNPNQYI